MQGPNHYKETTSNLRKLPDYWLHHKSTASERDLGLSVSSDLTWNNQVYEQAAHAKKLLGYIQRNAKFTINSFTSVRRTLYVGLVRPHIGYATQVWAP